MTLNELSSQAIWINLSWLSNLLSALSGIVASQFNSLQKKTVFGMTLTWYLCLWCLCSVTTAWPMTSTITNITMAVDMRFAKECHPQQTEINPTTGVILSPKLITLLQVCKWWFQNWSPQMNLWLSRSKTRQVKKFCWAQREAIAIIKNLNTTNSSPSKDSRLTSKVSQCFKMTGHLMQSQVYQLLLFRMRRAKFRLR